MSNTKLTLPVAIVIGAALIAAGIFLGLLFGDRFGEEPSGLDERGDDVDGSASNTNGSESDAHTVRRPDNQRKDAIAANAEETQPTPPRRGPPQVSPEARAAAERELERLRPRLARACWSGSDGRGKVELRVRLMFHRDGNASVHFAGQAHDTDTTVARCLSEREWTIRIEQPPPARSGFETSITLP